MRKENRLLVDRHEGAIGLRDGAGASHTALDQRHLSEHSAFADRLDDVAVEDDVDLSALHDEHLFSGISLLENHFPRGKRLEVGRVSKQPDRRHGAHLTISDEGYRGECEGGLKDGEKIQRPRRFATKARRASGSKSESAAEAAPVEIRPERCTSARWRHQEG